MQTIQKTEISRSILVKLIQVSITFLVNEIKDSLKKIKNKGIDFVVCFVDLENEFNILSFNLVQEPNKRLFTYNVRNDFKIKTIEGVDVLFEDFNDKSIKSPKDIDKKSKELLDKKIISFKSH